MGAPQEAIFNKENYQAHRYIEKIIRYTSIPITLASQVTSFAYIEFLFTFRLSDLPFYAA